MVKYMIDPIKYFESKQNTKSMGVDDIKYPINATIHKQQVNNYVNREAGLRITLDKIYGFVWGQCSHGIKSIISNKRDFKEKMDVFDCL